MKEIAKIIATSFGFGFAPVAPGTFGAIFGCIIVWILSLSGWINVSPMNLNIILIILTIIFLLLGIWSTNELESEWGHDPGKIVMDETIGLWISCLFIPMTWTNLILAFILFRFFDILKPLGIKYFESWKGGYGVMFDDVVAGIYANIILQIIVYSGVLKTILG